MENDFYGNFSSFLSNSGVKSTSSILVHSALKRLGSMGVDGNDCCDFLCSYVAAGNILMPTMTWKTVNVQNPFFYSNVTPSHTGLLTEKFRQSFASHRSLHPTHSVACFGVNSEVLTSQHHLSKTPCDRKSPYGVIADFSFELDTWVLLINVGLESCTFIHHFEEIIAPEVYVSNMSETYTLFDSNNNKSSIVISPHSNVMRDFHQYGRELFLKNKLFRLIKPNYSLLLFRTQDLSELIISNLNKNKCGNLIGYSYVR